jgi:hypothetical protein
MFREAMVEQGARRDLACNICNNITEVQNSVLSVENSYAITGTSKAYTVSRLKNNRPDLFEKVVCGELDAIMKAKRGQTVGEVLALKPHGTNRFAEDRGNKNENITSIEQRGTASTYRIAKLKRDAPEIAERRFNSAPASPVDIRTL